MKPSLILTLLAVGCVSASAATIVVNFDELPTQPANGLTVNGVSIGFTVGGSSSVDATFNQDLPVATTYLDDHVAAGSLLGVLTFQFAMATSSFQFGLALNTLDPEQPGATVELFNPALQSLGTMPLDTIPLVLFSEGQFVYSGVPVSRIAISLSQTTAADLFAVDNLQYEGDLAGVPEPRTWLLTAIGAAMLLLRRR